MLAFPLIRSVLMAVLALLLAALASMPFLMQSTEEATERALRHDTAWIGVHGREEYHELLRLLLEHRANPQAVPKETVFQAYEIVIARIETMGAGAFRRLALQLPEGSELLARLAAMAERLDPIMMRLPESDARQEAVTVAKSFQSEIERLSRGVFTASMDDMSESRLRLHWLQRIQRVLIALLVGGGFLLVFLLIRHNRLLVAANRAERQAAAENAFLASHDPLTRLRNRSSVLAELATRLAPGAWPVGVLMIDLDGFKPVNDVLGHKAGDALLASVATRLTLVFPADQGNVVGRFGGDEFVVVTDGLAGIDAMMERAEAALTALHAPHEIEGHRIEINATIGLAVGEGALVEASELVNQADVALIQAKARGKGITLLYEHGMGDALARRQRLEGDLAEADLDVEFSPHYQPVVDLQTGRIVAVESLARWRHPQRGMISPAEFIPAAEASGRISDIGWTILAKACRDALLMPPEVTVAVNVSAVQLMRSDFVLRVQSIMGRAGLSPRRLKLEVTESVLITDAGSVRTALEKLQALGVAVSLDDFGTGFSSLSYLSGFGFDELKIDRQFVDAMTGDDRTLAIVQAMVALARSLDMTTVGEGVETEEQELLLRALGCARGQGYRFGRPEPIEVLLQRFEHVDETRGAHRAVA